MTDDERSDLHDRIRCCLADALPFSKGLGATCEDMVIASIQFAAASASSLDGDKMENIKWAIESFCSALAQYSGVSVKLGAIGEFTSPDSELKMGSFIRTAKDVKN
jgi:hypothetical protein